MRTGTRFVGGIVRHGSIVKILAVILTICSFAVAQSPRCPGLPKGLDRYPGTPADVPPEFEFLYCGGIPTGQLKTVWAALPYESITLERSMLWSSAAYKVTFYRGSPSGQGRESFEDRFGPAEMHVTAPGTVFPAKTGDFSGKVDIWTYARLCYLLRSQLSGLSDHYESGWSDQQTFTVTVTGGGNTKTVSEYGGVGPIGLWGLQQTIDSVAQGINWTAK
jgi:hypothetical protein